ncbi:MAG: exodeoxyribonuclease VII large subunit, partial [Nocardioidaceae bacterium]|nr:exodeoxyribonuclease VII large subunit [Nocardioidaceae bacterium]
SVGHRLERAHDDLGHQLARVRALSPLATLRRGYAVVQDADGHVVTEATTVPTGSDLRIRVAEGRIGATVTHTEPTDAQESDA